MATGVPDVRTVGQPQTSPGSTQSPSQQQNITVPVIVNLESSPAHGFASSRSHSGDQDIRPDSSTAENDPKDISSSESLRQSAKPSEMPRTQHPPVSPSKHHPVSFRRLSEAAVVTFKDDVIKDRLTSSHPGALSSSSKAVGRSQSLSSSAGPVTTARRKLIGCRRSQTLRSDGGASRRHDSTDEPFERPTGEGGSEDSRLLGGKRTSSAIDLSTAVDVTSYSPPNYTTATTVLEFDDPEMMSSSTHGAARLLQRGRRRTGGGNTTTTTTSSSSGPIRYVYAAILFHPVVILFQRPTIYAILTHLCVCHKMNQ